MRLSLSGITDWLTCRRLWYLRHVLRLSPAVKPVSQVAGILYHQALAARLQELDPDWEPSILFQTSDPGLARAKARAGFRLWNPLEGEPKKVEAWVEKKIGDHVWLARIDLLLETPDGLAVVDHKLTTYPNWEWFRTISDQLILYSLLLDLEADFGIWDIMVLPGIRRKKAESYAEFEDRLVQTALSSGPGQVIMPVYFTELEERQTREKLEEIGEEISRGKIFRNPGACVRGCPYTLICRDESQADRLGFVVEEPEIPEAIEEVADADRV